MTLQQYLHSVREFKPSTPVTLEDHLVRKGWEFNLSINYAYRRPFKTQQEAQLLICNGALERALGLYLQECVRFRDEGGTTWNDFWIRPNTILNLKLILGEPYDIQALEMSYYLRQHTSEWCKDKIPDFLQACNHRLALQRQSLGKAIIRYIAEFNLDHFSGKNQSSDSIYNEIWPYFYSRPLDHADPNGLPNYRGVPFLSSLLDSRFPATKFSDYLKQVARDAENDLRVSRGLPKVGEGWISETELFEAVRNHFLRKHKVYHHGQPAFLGRQHFDIWIPDLRAAIEYQGQQHYVPVDHFGGADGYQKTRQRDERKKLLADQNGVVIILANDSTRFFEIVASLDSLENRSL
jgi:hypothetical protein